ncbi:MAG TPA: apolipoprotein N-acyltransferase [Spirochaetota bacterium]|nr:apolipoprotein N-acyltransferase [Spirochaetota bacterium]
MYLLLPLLSSLLYILSFPFNISGYIAYIALVPLFLLFSSTAKKAFASGAIFGTVISIYFSIPLYHSLTINTETSLVIPALLVLITVILPCAIIYAAYSVICRWSENLPLFLKLLFPASLWITIDYARGLSPFILPWGLAGYTQVYSPFIQSAAIGGIHLVTFITVLINTLIAEIIFHVKQHRLSSTGNTRISEIIKNKKIIYCAITLLIFSVIDLAYGLTIKEVTLSNENKSDKINYLIVQGNYGSIERWNESSTGARYHTYATLTGKGINKADFIVWPETVLNSSDKINYEVMTGISSLLNDKSYFIAGGVRRDSKKHTFNSIFVSGKNGLEYIYDKKYLFPYSEQPFLGMSAGSFMNSPEKFKEGKSPDIYKTGNFLTGFSICFESIYPQVIRRAALSGASLLINVANDSWFGESSVPFMQMYAVITRAIENRVSIIRAANSGISFAVSPSGKVVSEIPLNTRDISQGELPVSVNRSFYSRGGDMIIIFAIIIILSALLLDELKKSRNNIS